MAYIGETTIKSTYNLNNEAIIMNLNRETINLPIRQIALFCMLLLSCSISVAGIYKWVDEEGIIHYGQQRPADASSEKMDVQQYAPNDTSSYKRPGSKTDEEGKTANDETEKKAEEPVEPEKKKETAAEKKRRLAACAKARNNLSKMQSIGRIRSKDKDGNVTYMSQKQKEARMSQTKSLIAKHCK